MNIDEFISDFSSNPIYIDSNIFLYTIFKDSKYFAACYNLLRSIEENKIQSVTSCLAIDEVSSKLIVESIKSSHKFTSISRIFKEVEKNPAIMEAAYTPLFGFSTIISNYKSLKVVSLKENNSSKIFHNIIQYHLLPRDAWHLSIIQQEKIGFIATNDKHFRNISDITTVTP
ncbi:MAG: type II toxin-antitoxin system VapC family toxin [Candidatus Omnitrophica bacterium]|nr:type II toxin-antitoxin system VapC family toxin [Candidatus Omnitrophota bacterium]MBU1809750.1 type II toxin-antitoxin system VapC family toxin [Candidatus Omnitrophota bacterium]